MRCSEQLYRLTKMEDIFAHQRRRAGRRSAADPGSARPADGLPRAPLRGDPAAHRVRAGAKAADRLHLVEGLLIAIVDIDDVIAIIRAQRRHRARRGPG